MAQQLKLKAQIRTGIGRTAVNKLRRQGLVPAVIYGGQDPSLPLSVEAREFNTLLSHLASEHVLVDLEITDGEKSSNRLALIQEVKHHTLKRHVMHVDFHAVKSDTKIHAEIPVETVGEPNGVKNFGGLLEIAIHNIEIQCFPKDLPEKIVIDVTDLNVGDAVHVRDITFPEGVTATAAPDLTVIRVAAPKVESAAAAEVAPAAPEVIKEKKDEDKK